MVRERAKEMALNDCMSNMEFLDHNECVTEMQIFVQLFCNYLTKNWGKPMRYNQTSDIF